ncbi:MAG TPA: methyltransferase domain-containing protein [Terriglobia bacterium]|nr:methyltransferase domain-containing protein [Terriglobia bacterium]
MRRIISRELLDDDLGNPGDVEASLLDLWRINLCFGGVSGSLKLFDRFFARSRSCAQPIRILDVGAGDGRMAAWLQQALALRGFKPHFCVLDRRISHLNAWQPSHYPLQRVVANALELPFQQDAFEIVTCNLFVHHFSGVALHTLLRQMLRVAREAVLVNDLERRWPSYLFIRYAPFVAHSPLTRPDGAASVRQAYTRREFAAAAASCGAASSDVMALPFFRLGVILWKKPL